MDTYGGWCWFLASRGMMSTVEPKLSIVDGAFDKTLGGVRFVEKVATSQTRSLLFLELCTSVRFYGDGIEAPGNK